MTSPGIGRLPSQFSQMGGIVIDMVGANGKRLTAQIPPSKLSNGWVAANQSFYSVWTQGGFDVYTLQTLLGGGLTKVNIRVTLEDGDSGSPNPVYTAMFGAGNFPYRSADPKQPANYDFDGGTDLYWAIKLADGSYINTGYMGLTTTYRLDGNGNDMESFTGFPGVYALSDYSRFPTTPRPSQYMPPFAVTGWFSVPAANLPVLYQTLSSTGAMTLGIWDVDPGDQYYDFTQGTGSNILEIPLIPAHVVSFTATPSAVFGSDTVTLAWQTQSATSVSIDNAVSVDPSTINGSIQVNVASATTFTLTATGTGGNDTAKVTIQVLPPLSATTTALPIGIAGSAYSQTLGATGGTSPYAWKLASGSLPPGLSLSSLGILFGTPTTPSTSSFIAQIIDSSNPAQTVTVPLSLTITPGLSISTLSLPNAVIGSPYNQPINASGGTTPYLWSLTTSSLPAGLSLSTNGTISGIPTAAGTTNFTVRVIDSTTPTAQSVTQNYTLTVGSQLAIQTTTLLTGAVSSSYSQTLMGLGGTTPYTWSVDSGPLPAGLSLNPTTGTISGTPTAPGLTTFIVRVTDRTAPSAQTVTQSLNIYVVQPLVIDTLTAPAGTAAHPYALGLNVHNGVQPYLWTVATGSLPPGLQLLASGAILGTPAQPGDYAFTLQVADSSIFSSLTATQAYAIHINPAFTITTTALPEGSTGLPYTAAVKAINGQPPYIFAVIFGNMPPGLVLNPDGTIGGTPTTPGVYNLLMRATDSTTPAAQTAAQPLVISIDSNLAIVTASLPDGTENIPYNQTLTAVNGTQPYTWTVSNGSLPRGLTLLASGAILGTPTADAIYNFTIQATDATRPNAATTTRAYTVKIARPLILTTDTLANGIIDSPYTAVFTTVGGIQPYIYSMTVGTLPPGLNLSPIGVLSGSPTTAGKYTFSIAVCDSSVIYTAVVASFTVEINQPLTVPTPTLPSTVIGSLYTQQLTANGGMSPYTWTMSSGSLPPGLSLLAPGVLIGTPTTAGTYAVTVQVTDSTTATPQTATATVSITVLSPLVLNSQALAPVLPNAAYLATLTATGGVQPYSWTISAGSLPSGLSITPNGTISGTTTATAASYPITITVADSAQQPQSAFREFVLLVASPFAITTTSPILPAVVGATYSQQLTFSSGKTPFSCSATGGALPDGLTLSTDGTITGPPSTVGTAQFVITCKDAAGQTSMKPLAITVQQALSIVAGTIPPVIANTPYFRLFQAAGGNGPYVWSVSSGTIPPGLTLTVDGLLTGTATNTGTFNATITVTDSTQTKPQTAALPITLNVAPALSAISQNFVGTVGTAFKQTVAATGGATPLAWTTASGSLPPGLALTKDGSISGTPTASGSYSVVLNVTDNIGQVAAAFVTFTISDTVQIPLPTLPNGAVGVGYAALLHATGGGQPYNWTISSGAVLPGLTLSSSGGISGVPTSSGSFTFTATVNTGTQEASHQFSITISPAPPAISIPATSAALPPATVGVLYHAHLSATGTVSPVSWSVSSGSLPAGVTLDPTGSLGGTPTVVGAFSFGLTIQDNTRRTATQSYFVTVSPNIAITTIDLGKATVGSGFATGLTATGGTGPYNWTVGQLPPGLFISKTGVLSGTPSAAGQFTITVTVTDNSALPLSASKTFSFSVASALTIVSASSLIATAATPFSYTFTAANGVPTYTWSLTDGFFGPGLSLASNGVVSGTPTKSGTWFFTVQVADSAGATATRQLIITVADSLTITTAPLAALSVGSPVSVQFAATGGSVPYTWRAASGGLPTGLAFTSSGELTGTPTTAGSFTVGISATDTAQHTATSQYILVVTAAEPPPLRVGPDAFTLDPTTQTPVTVSLTSPFTSDLSGTLTVSGTNDQDMGLLQSGKPPARSIRFIIPAGSTVVVFSDGNPLLQAGTVAGAITLSAELDNTPQAVTAQDRVLPLMPNITAGHYQKNAGGFDLIIDGYSTTRDMQTATFRFYGTNNVTSPPFTLSVADIFNAWYQASASRGTGIFSYRQSFTLSGDLASLTLTYVEVSLTNSVGTSSTQQILAQ